MGTVLPQSPAKVLQILFSVFCNKSMFILLKRKKKRFWHFLVCKAQQKTFFFKSGNRGGCVARHWRARLLCCGSGSTATPLGLTELPLDARPGQGYGPKGVSPLQVSLQDFSWSVPCELPPGSSIVIYCIRFNSYAHKTFTEYHNYLSQTNGKYFLKQIV